MSSRIAAKINQVEIIKTVQESVSVGSSSEKNTPCYVSDLCKSEQSTYCSLLVIFLFLSGCATSSSLSDWLIGTFKGSPALWLLVGSVYWDALAGGWKRGEWEKSSGFVLGWLLRLTASLFLKVTASCQVALSVMSSGPVPSPCFLQMEQLVASGFHFPLRFPTPCPYLCKVPFVSCRGPDWYNGVNKITAAVEAWASLSEKWWDCGVIHSLNKGFPQPSKGDRRLYKCLTAESESILVQRKHFPPGGTRWPGRDGIWAEDGWIV